MTDSLRVVLVRTRNPLNVGAAARALANFGCADLRLVAPYDPAFREARSAVGAADLLARAHVFSNIAEAIADCTYVVATTARNHRDLKIPVADLPQAATLIHNQCARGTVAVIFGSEKSGLSNADLSHCHLALHIPTAAQQPSMNLAQAVAVTLYELSRASPSLLSDELPLPLAERASAKGGTDVDCETNTRMPHPERPSAKGGIATAADLERLTALLLEAMDASDYPANTSPAAREQSLRELLLRLHPSANDATLLLGVLRQILWKLHHRP